MVTNNNNSWLLFMPQLPTSPSTLRTLVWRRLRQAGATSLQNGAWLLLKNPESEHLLQELLKQIETQGGSGLLLNTSPLDPAINEEFVERFRTDRDQEYSEFCQRCNEFMAEIEKETASQKFTFAELEENEDDLHKLTGWLRKIQARDFFKGHQAILAANKLADCQEALRIFTRAIYKKEGLFSNGNGSEEVEEEETTQPD